MDEVVQKNGFFKRSYQSIKSSKLKQASIFAVVFAVVGVSTLLISDAKTPPKPGEILLSVRYSDALQVQESDITPIFEYPDKYLTKDNLVVCKQEDPGTYTQVAIPQGRVKALLDNIRRADRGEKPGDDAQLLDKFTQVIINENEPEELVFFENANPGILQQISSFFETSCSRQNVQNASENVPDYIDPLPYPENYTEPDIFYDDETIDDSGQDVDVEGQEELSLWKRLENQIKQGFSTGTANALHAYKFDSIANEHFNRINKYRVENGKSKLRYATCLNHYAQAHAKRMAGKNTLYHSSMRSLIDSHIPSWCAGDAQVVGENVGRGGTSASQFYAFTQSSGHNRNMLDARYDHGGVGAYVHNGVLYIVQIYADCSSNCGGEAWKHVYSSRTHYLTNSNESGVADSTFKYGATTNNYTLTCDWTGRNHDNVIIYRRGVFYFRAVNSTGRAYFAVPYGPVNGAKPVCGDWNGNGQDTIGVVVNNNKWLLRNSNSPGGASYNFNYGSSSESRYTHIAGDWDGDGKDGVGIFINNNYFALRNPLTSGTSQIRFTYGSRSWSSQPLTGDWNGNGKDTIGVYRKDAARAYLRNSNTGGSADITFDYGRDGTEYQAITGDWNGDKIDTLMISPN